jgi:hypothetical protein
MARKTHTKHHDVSTGLYLVAMVGIVAVIGLVVLVMNSGSSATYDYDDLTGQAGVILGTSSSSVGSSNAVWGIYNPSSKVWVPVGVMQNPFRSQEEPIEDGYVGEESNSGSECDDYTDCSDACEASSLAPVDLNHCINACDVNCP